MFSFYIHSFSYGYVVEILGAKTRTFLGKEEAGNVGVCWENAEIYTAFSGAKRAGTRFCNELNEDDSATASAAPINPRFVAQQAVAVPPAAGAKKANRDWAAANSVVTAARTAHLEYYAEAYAAESARRGRQVRSLFWSERYTLASWLRGKGGENASLAAKELLRIADEAADGGSVQMLMLQAADLGRQIQFCPG
jgi:hypothetical protein